MKRCRDTISASDHVARDISDSSYAPPSSYFSSAVLVTQTTLSFALTLISGWSVALTLLSTALAEQLIT